MATRMSGPISRMAALILNFPCFTDTAQDLTDDDKPVPGAAAMSQAPRVRSLYHAIQNLHRPLSEGGLTYVHIELFDEHARVKEGLKLLCEDAVDSRIEERHAFFVSVRPSFHGNEDTYGPPAFVEFVRHDLRELLHFSSFHAHAESGVMAVGSSSPELIGHRIVRAEYRIVKTARCKHKRNAHFASRLKPLRADAFAVPSEHFIGYLVGVEVEHPRDEPFGDQLFHRHPAATVRMEPYHVITSGVQKRLCQHGTLGVDAISGHPNHGAFRSNYALPLHHAADSIGSLGQDVAHKIIESQKVCYGVKHYDIFCPDIFSHVPRCNR